MTGRGICSASEKNSRYHSPSPGRTGAMTWPHWPTMTVVWPLCTHEPQYGSHTACGSKWVWWSIKPGATTRPAASMVRLAAAPAYLPTPTILPSCTATSAANAGSPEPSTTRPFLMSRSKAMLIPPCCPPLRTSAAACRSGPPSWGAWPASTASRGAGRAYAPRGGPAINYPRTQLGYAVRDGLPFVLVTPGVKTGHQLIRHSRESARKRESRAPQPHRLPPVLARGKPWTPASRGGDELRADRRRQMTDLLE